MRPTKTMACALFAHTILAGIANAQQPFALGTNFSAADSVFSNSLSIPPDSMGAVGPHHIGVLINGRWSVYDKSTGATLAAMSQNQFWINSGIAATNYAFDPRLYYDDLSDRWFAVAVDNKSAANNFLVAVSATDDPTGGWTGFKIDADTNNAEWADFPMLGVNADTVTINSNMFTIGGSSAGVSNLLVIPKSNLLNATSSSANLQETLIEDLQHSAATGPGDTAQPLIDLTGGNDPIRLMSDQTVGPGRARITTLTGTPLTPSLVTSGSEAPITFSVPGWFGVEPQDVDQPLDPSDLIPRDPIDGGSSRFGGNVILQQVPGRAYPTIWGVTSARALFGTGNNVVHWAEFDPVTKAPLQSGMIDDPNLDLNFPSIAVNAEGEVVIGFSGGDSSTFMGSYVAVGRTDSGVTTFSEPRLTQAGQGAYERLDGSGRNRWGDYSATVLDPDSPHLFWTFQEFVSSTDEWQVQITQVSTLLGDVNADGVVDSADIDLLAANQGGADMSFDLNSDQLVQYGVSPTGQLITDSDVLVREILETEYGDLDLDGQVGVGDINTTTLTLVSSGVGGWADGEVTGDGLVTIADLNTVALNLGFGGSSPSSSVPEPTGVLPTLVLAATLPIFNMRKPRADSVQAQRPANRLAGWGRGRIMRRTASRL